MKSFIAPTLIALMTAGVSLPAATQTDHSAHGKTPASAPAVAPW
jgi:hypothetical protein